MESLAKIVKFDGKKPVKANPHLHSPAHLLADELSVRMNDRKHFGFYLKMATLYNHEFLRKLMGANCKLRCSQQQEPLFQEAEGRLGSAFGQHAGAHEFYPRRAGRVIL
jgi:hypothetical protein